MQRVAIIGGGPAGLAAGQALRQAGIAFTLFEAGKSLVERHHDAAADLGCGIGGAGLFSDGKFSFYPSGTELYRLRDRTRIARAYGAIERELALAGIESTPFPSEAGGLFDPEGQTMAAKPYLSTYGSLDQRRALIASMTREFAESILCGTSVTAIRRTGDGFRVVTHGPDDAAGEEDFSHLVLATGRFGSQTLAEMMAKDAPPMTDLRFEFGIRIEHPAGLGFLSRVNRADVKFILDALDTEVRTFCTCRNGEVWMIPYAADVAALSGRSDGPPSGYCNFGLLARFTGDRFDAGRRIWAELQDAIGDDGSATWQPLEEFLGQPAAIEPVAAARPWFPRDRFVRGDVASRLPGELRHVLAEALRLLIDRFPDLSSPETVCLFPAVEGVGAFPDLDEGLRDPGGRIWCCGDVVGRFRGLVPAMVSGAYVGAAVAAALADREGIEDDAWHTVAAQ